MRCDISNWKISERTECSKSDILSGFGLSEVSETDKMAFGELSEVSETNKMPLTRLSEVSETDKMAFGGLSECSETNKICRHFQTVLKAVFDLTSFLFEIFFVPLHN
jgi:hypothetical protein